MFGVIHVAAEDVPWVLAVAAVVCLGSFAGAFLRPDYWGSPNRNLLSVAAAAAIAFVTLGLTSL